jgi:hypothetical protein
MMGMSEENTPGAEPKKKSLAALLPEKEAVSTSLGPLFVRHLTASDLPPLDGREDLGAAVLKLLVGRNREKTDHSGLSDEDFAALSEADIAVLVPVAIVKSGWPPLEGARTLGELGSVARAGLDAHKQQLTSLLEGIRTKIGADYSFLGKGALDRLKDQVSGLAALRGGFGGSLQDALKAAESPSEQLRRMAGESSSEQLRRMAGESSSEQLRRMAGSSPSEQLRRMAEESPTEQLRRLAEGSSSSPAGTIASPGRPRTVESLRMPSPEDSPIGRATLQTAEQTRLLAAKMDALVDVVGGLNQTLVTDVLPAWFKQVTADQKHAEETLKQAANGLFWTKWAVIASVVATLGTAAWQVHVAREVDRSTGALLERSEAVLKEQLRAQQILIEQQARDAEALRQALSRLQARPPAGAASRGSPDK